VFVFRPVHQTTMSTPYLCYNCKQSGHIKRHCPRLLVDSTTAIHSTIGRVPAASISDSISHSCVAIHKNGVTGTSLIESSLNKTQASICTPEVLPVFLHSTCTSSKVSLQQSSSSFITNDLSKRDADKRFSPYPIPYCDSRHGSLPKTRQTVRPYYDSIGTKN
jgi:hypothetical protein